MPIGVYPRTEFHRKIISKYHADFKGSKSALWKGGQIIKKCEYCNKDFLVYPYRLNTAKTCSRSCSLKNKVGDNSLAWKGGKIKVICNGCNLEFSIDRWKKRTFCSKECFLKNNVLGRHFNWKGGKSFEPYPLGWTKTFKEQIRFRDGYKCQMCGVSESECKAKLHVHHIDYIKSNLNINNLISLCNSCHVKTNYNREFWKEYFCGKDHTTTI